MTQTKNHERVLVVAAHPDDEILGCGATIAKHVAMGDEAQSIVLGEGITSRRDLTIDVTHQELDILRHSAESAAHVLGVAKIVLKQLPDNKFDAVPLLDVVHAIEEISDIYKPTIIYTHNIGDVNIDHEIVSRAIEAVARPLPKSSIKRVLSFEVPSSTEWNFVKPSMFRPNIFVELTEEYLKKKLEAFGCYKSEMRDFPHPRSLEYIRALAVVRGGQSGYLLAEAFQLIYMR